MTIQQANRRALVLLAVGAAVGTLLGVATTLRGSGSGVIDTLPDGAVALVNGRPLLEEEYVRAVALLAADKRTEMTNEDRRHVLNRLIEEELLIQHGIEIGLVESNLAVRQAITRAMLAAIVTESASVQPTENELCVFYQKNLSLFTRRVLAADGQETTEGNPAFAEVREEVEGVYLRRSRDEALQEYLEWLRSEATIALASEAQ